MLKKSESIVTIRQSRHVRDAINQFDRSSERLSETESFFSTTSSRLDEKPSKLLAVKFSAINQLRRFTSSFSTNKLEQKTSSRLFNVIQSQSKNEGLALRESAKKETSQENTKKVVSRVDAIREASRSDTRTTDASRTDTKTDASRSNTKMDASGSDTRRDASQSDTRGKRRKSKDTKKQSLDAGISSTRNSTAMTLSKKKGSTTGETGGKGSTLKIKRSRSSRPFIECDEDESGEDYEDDEDKPKKIQSKSRQHPKKRDKKFDKDEERNLVRPSMLLIKRKKKGKKSKETLSSQHDLKDTSSRDEFIANEMARIKALTIGNFIQEVRSGSRDTERSSTKTEEQTEEKPKKPKKTKKLKKRKIVTREKKSPSTILLEQEAERLRLIAEEKAHAEEVRIRGIEKQKREIHEQQLRMEQLSKSVDAIRNIINYNMQLAEIEKENLEWKLYLDCGRLPNPSLCDQMNTYLHLWSLAMENTTIEDASKRTHDVMQLLDDLEDLLDGADEENSHAIENYMWIYELLKEFQNVSLNIATYRLLRDVDRNMNRVDIQTANYSFSDDHMDMNLWLRLNLPIPLPNPRRPPKSRIDITFPRLNVRLLFPPNVLGENMAIRLLYLKYDHLSETCEHFHLDCSTDHLDLLKATREEWRIKMRYKYLNRIIDADTPESQMGETYFRDDEEIPIVPYRPLEPSASIYYLNKEYDDFFNSIKHYFIYPPLNVINLRKFSIIGGIFHVDLLYQPPQPQQYVTVNLNMTSLYLPKELRYVPFYADNLSPSDSGASILPELNIEDVENLLQVKMAWPKHVVFPELPILCRWELDEKNWTTTHIHDVEYDVTNGTVQFKTAVFGVFAFASLRYIHLPYQNWRITPDKDDSVTVKIITSILRMDFNIKGGLICLSLLDNCSKEVLKDVVGNYMKLNRLGRHLKEAGIDIFPEGDAFCYVNNISEKHGPMVQHLYCNIAELSNCFKFAWSKWNANGGRRNVVLQMKEFCPAIGRVKNTYSTLYITPLKATFVNCTETSLEFSDEEVENIKFSADLYNLMKVTNGIAIRKRVAAANKDTIFSLTQFLLAIRLISFS